MIFDFEIKLGYLHEGEKPQELCLCIKPDDTGGIDPCGHCELPFGKYGTRTNPYKSILEALDASYAVSPDGEVKTFFVNHPSGRIRIHE